MVRRIVILVFLAIAPLVAFAQTGPTITAGAKGSTAAATLTSEDVDANTQALHVFIKSLDANNAAITRNPYLIGVEALSSQPTAATTGNLRRLIGSLDGALYVRPNGPVLWSCGLTGIAATLTQCQAAPAAGQKLYVTDIQVGSNTATAGQFLIRYGTGSNCVTGTTTLYPNIPAQTTAIMPYPANTASLASINFTSPPVAAAANAICIVCVATNTCVVNMTGYTAP
jgi:hypothetical protein